LIPFLSSILLLSSTSTMSNEADTNNAGEQAPSPKKKSKPNDDAIEERRNAAISWIPDDTKKHPQLYKNVVAHIKKISTQRRFTETSLYKAFMGWSELAKPNDRPKLDYMIAALAVHDSYEGRQRQFQLEIDSRGLREWVDKKLEVPAQTATPARPTVPEAQQKTPQVKTEPGAQNANINTIRQSIEEDRGVKRPAPSQSTEPMNKRANIGTSQALETPKVTAPMLQLPQQRIVFREAGTQTDQAPAIDEASRDIRMATAAMNEQTRAMREQFEVMRDNNGMISNAFGRSQLTQARPPINSVQQQAFQIPPQEVYAVPPGTFQPGSRRLFYNPNSEWQ
jgi:hypothetical protein